MRRVTKTKTTTTLYDTNGKQISVVRKEEEIVEAPVILTREEAKTIKQIVENYKTDLEHAKAVKSNLLQVRGYIKGTEIFHDMADLIMIVENPLSKSSSTNRVKPFKNELDSVLRAAEVSYTTDTEFSKSLNKKKRSKK